MLLNIKYCERKRVYTVYVRLKDISLGLFHCRCHRFCKRWNFALLLGSHIQQCSALCKVTALNRNSHPMWYRRMVLFLLTLLALSLSPDPDIWTSVSYRKIKFDQGMGRTDRQQPTISPPGMKAKSINLHVVLATLYPAWYLCSAPERREHTLFRYLACVCVCKF